MVQFADMQYMPTLLLRGAELKAISQLSAAQKDLLFPLFRLRPWLGKQPFPHAITKVSECMGNRPFAADLDDVYEFPPNRDRVPVREFEAMLADQSCQSWYDMVQQHEHVIPCIRLSPPVALIIDTISQDWIAERGFGIVLTHANAAHHGKLAQILGSIRHNNYFVMIDAGWSLDPLVQAAWASGLALRVAAANVRASMFVSSSSFLQEFGDIGLGDDAPPSEVVPMLEYSLHAEVSRVVTQRYNQARVRYADWATTRPQVRKGGGGWVPRLDIPENGQIRIFRDRSTPYETQAATCTRLAQTVVAQAGWPQPPPSWGHYSIDMTASGSEAGIYHAGTNTAARINMYLHRVIDGFADVPPATLVEPFDL